MSCNLLKYGNTMLDSENKVVVDSNEIIAQKLQVYRENHPIDGGFQSGLNAREIDIVETEDGLPREEGDPEFVTEPVAQQPVYEGPDPEELIAEAQAEIEQMKQDAMDEIEIQKEQIFEDARKKGYDAGYDQGNKDGLQRLDRERQAISQERLSLKAEYEQMISDLEPDLVDTINDIYMHIFHVDMTMYKDIVSYLIMNTLSHIESCKNYLIHVSKDDYAYMSMQKKDIKANSLAGNAVLEFVEDISLNKGECLIETDSGIYDCGLDTHLQELSKKLRILSYEKE